MSLIRKHGAVLQAWACLDLVFHFCCIKFMMVWRYQYVDRNIKVDNSHIVYTSRWGERRCIAAASVRKVGAGSCTIFWPTTANIRQRRYGCSEVQHWPQILCQNGGFLVPIFVLLEENFATKISNRLKFWEDFPFAPPLCHDATANAWFLAYIDYCTLFQSTLKTRKIRRPSADIRVVQPMPLGLD